MSSLFSIEVILLKAEAANLAFKFDKYYVFIFWIENSLIIQELLIYLQFIVLFYVICI